LAFVIKNPRIPFLGSCITNEGGRLHPEPTTGPNSLAGLSSKASMARFGMEDAIGDAGVAAIEEKN
jgi:hypothetical protein